MHAVPKAPGNRSVDKRKGDKRSRLKKILDERKQPRLPGTALEYLVEFLLEVGPTASNGLGASPLSHAEIRAWRRDMRLSLQPWEISMLRRLSIEWSNQAAISEDADCPPPWGEIIVPTREEVAAKIDSVLAMLG